jgi:hypothetical protein
MCNIILTAMLINVILNYLLKRNVRANLNCGIFAWTGTSSDKFSPFMFNVLGVYNDTRGGDSTGVYFNRGDIRGIHAESRYETLVKNHKLHTTLKPGKWPIVIGHCRKASVGTINEVNIQPALIRDTFKGNKLVYVQAHNGTVTNHKELAKKYNIAVVAEESDSITLSKLIAKEGFKILSEYEGSAALIMHFIKEPNTLYAFHGQSKNYNVLTEERPLHYLNIKGSGTYLSSESAPLEFIGNGEKATPFKYNMLYKLTGDTVEEFQKIEREKAVLKEYKGNPSYTPRSYNYYEEIEEYRDCRMVSLPSKSGMLHIGITKNVCTCNVENISKPVIIEGRVRYSKGFYLVGREYAHGLVIVNAWGYVMSPDSYGSTMQCFHLWFYYGILLLDKQSFNDVKKEASKLGVKNSSDFLQPNNFSKISGILRNTSVQPFTRLHASPGIGYQEPTDLYQSEDKSKNSTFFTGTFSPLFSDYKLFFDAGDLMGYKRIDSINLITDLLKEVPYLSDLDFGQPPTKNIHDKELTKGITSCTDCWDKGFYGDGTHCMECELEFKGEEEKNWKREEDKYADADNQVTLCHTIASQVAPIIGDLEDLIGEINDSGFQHVVEEKLEILVSANNKLKEIAK